MNVLGDRHDLKTVAQRVMSEHGFDLVGPPGVSEQLSSLTRQPPASTRSDVRDLRGLPWSSIDNDTTRDLDQLEVADALPGGGTRIRIAIADVDALVARDSPIDRFAAGRTTSVYTGIQTFPMLPDELSSGLTSLLGGADRLVTVIDFVVGTTGRVESREAYRALARNSAQLTYRSVGAWLDGGGPAPHALQTSAVLADQLRLQDRTAQLLRRERHRLGALNIQTAESRAVVGHDGAVLLEAADRNRATMMIEDFMIAANEVVARLLEDDRRSSIRRIVRTPARWDRIVTIAAAHGVQLPAQPDSGALNAFLVQQAAADPDHFADLSLAVIKLMGPGEYVLERAGETGAGHFGLAVEDYTHATAPNRRFADLVTERLLKAMLAGAPPPYSDEELGTIAAACTERGNAARKVEREVGKRLAAVAMKPRIGETFDAIVTGVNKNGTFVRVLRPHVEGLLQHPAPGTDVGDKLRVRLVATDVDRGYVDFAMG